jgi:hypothetical protein
MSTEGAPSGAAFRSGVAFRAREPVDVFCLANVSLGASMTEAAVSEVVVCGKRSGWILAS